MKLTLAADLDARADEGSAVCVVTAPGQAYTVAMVVEAGSLAFLPGAEQLALFDQWGEVLGGLCVEHGTELTAERIGWCDVHRSANPGAMASYQTTHGTAGPASLDYSDYVAGFATSASSHQVVLSVTITVAGRLRLARTAGFTGSTAEVMTAAALAVAKGVRASLEARGYRVRNLLSPAEYGRLVVEVGDPFAPRSFRLTAKERFGLPERSGPNQVTVDRRSVAIDGAYHRVFALTWPRVRVAPNWLWKPLGEVPGPKMVSMMFEPIAPSAADRRREALRSRASNNNSMVAHSRGGRVRTNDLRKTTALADAERAVDQGHQELDGYALVVMSGESLTELDRRCQQLLQKLRESGRAGARELVGEHDWGFALALPLGLTVKPAVE